MLPLNGAIGKFAGMLYGQNRTANAKLFPCIWQSMNPSKSIYDLPPSGRDNLHF
jgi:hypothetical protein